jgi:molecular chaperone DnaK (HSP70)
VTFLIDANGILSVTAKEVRSGTQASVEVRPTYGLSDADVERMIDESLEHAEADVRARGLIDARNEADTVLRATEKALVQGAAFLGVEEAARIREAAAALSSAREGDDADAIREATARVNQETQQLAERLMDSALRDTLRERRVADVPAGEAR